MNIFKFAILVALGICLGCQTEQQRITDFIETPITDNPRAHENQEWTHSDAFNLRSHPNYPRALLVGDSICNGYRMYAKDMLMKHKVTMTYWISSYCVTSPRFLRIFSFYLEEAKYDVIHFNNGLHSMPARFEDWEKGFRAAIKLIRIKQPQAKIVWCNSTPVKNEKRIARVRELNALASRIVKEEGGIVENDLFSLTDKCDHNNLWVDGVHFTEPVKEMQAKRVTDIIVEQLGERVK